MKIQLLFIALLVVSVFASMPVQAVPGPAAGECQHYYHSSVVGLALTVQVGDNELWTSAPGCGIARSNTQVLEYTATYSGPVILSVVGLVQTNLVGDTLVGCTISGFTNHAYQLAAGTGSTAYGRITMTSNECHGAIEFKATLTVAAAIVFQWDVFDPLDIRVEQTVFTNNNNNANFDYFCRATGGTPNAFNPATATCTDPIVNGNQFNYLCDAPGIVPNSFNPATITCNDPNINTVVSGTLTLAGTLNVVNSGGQNIAITSWPTLNAVLSGGLTITDDANGWIIHQDALTGTVNVVNSGGQTIAVSSWPTLLATISGNLNVHQDQACGASKLTQCYVDLECRDETCKSTNVTSNVGNTTNSSNLNLSLTSFPLLLLAIAFFAVMGETRKDALYWFLCTILSIYLLIIRPSGSVIPVSVYVGWIFVTLYQGISLLMNARAPRVDGENE